MFGGTKIPLICSWHFGSASVVAAQVIEAVSSSVKQELRKDRRAFLDSKGQTPLHVAVAANHLDATRVLVETWPAWIGVQDRHRDQRHAFIFDLGYEKVTVYFDW